MKKRYLLLVSFLILMLINVFAINDATDHTTNDSFIVNSILIFFSVVFLMILIISKKNRIN